jgi:hypothetical protein
MRLTPFVLTGAAALALARSAAAQSHHPPSHQHPDPDVDARPGAHDAGSMTRPLGIPATREGSGTSWQPDNTPMHAYHASAAGWELMGHGLIFAGFDVQGTDRGDEQLFSPNWIMGMARHRALGGDITLRAMLSFDAVTMGEEGYPLLLQSGEAVDGEPLIDRQHPHDLFMELAAAYMVPLGSSVALELYGGPAGEPALGPAAFPHRRSAAADPLATLSHHWQDSTHISFGVLTAALVTRLVKLEATWFNGREPDQHRYDFDLRGFDSYAARVSVNPAPAWSAQASYGFLDSPEELEPEVSLHKVTASVMHAGRIDWAESVASTAVWGRNIPSDGEATDAFLVESTLDLGAPGSVFGRAELVFKDGHHLGLEPEMEHDTFAVGSLVLGYLYDFAPVGGLVPGVGVRGSLNVIGDELAEVYGTSTPAGAMVYVRIEPAAMDHSAHGSGRH